MFAKKNLGQHFLINDHYLQKIASCMDRSLPVFEIGPGTGNLTDVLLKKGGHVVGLEKDNRLISKLKNQFQKDNFKICHGDILSWGEEQIYNQFPGNIKLQIFGNLPYYISTPILSLLCGWENPPEIGVFLIQKEVAQRIVAGSGSKRYGSFSIMMQYYLKPEIIDIVPADAFDPPPNVQSAIIQLKYYKKLPFEVDRPDLFFDWVRLAFSQRRKMLKNVLTSKNNTNYTTDQLAIVFEKLNIELKSRPEDLSLEQYLKLYKDLNKMKGDGV